MATWISTIKSNSWLTVDEIKEWLDIDSSKIDVPAEEVKATKIVQDILFTAKLDGVLGNAISVEYIAGGTAGSELVSVLANKITVQIEDGVSTADQIRSAIATHGPASALVFVELVVVEPDVLVDVQNRTQILQAEVFLIGGSNDVAWSTVEDYQKVQATRRRIENLINIACDKVESIIKTSVIAKQFQEDLDGSNSSAIVPSRWPIISVEEIKIDYNRDFSANSIVDSFNYLLRGYADKRQSLPSSLRIVGDKIHLRDDDSDNVIGKIFSGSEVGSVRVKYTSGWATNIADIPSDLKHAATLLVEYYEFKRSNRDLGVSSKGVRGESYSKLIDGIPETIHEMLNEYIDHGFGTHNKPQNNVFGV